MTISVGVLSFFICVFRIDIYPFNGILYLDFKQENPVKTK